MFCDWSGTLRRLLSALAVSNCFNAALDRREKCLEKYSFFLWSQNHESCRSSTTRDAQDHWAWWGPLSQTMLGACERVRVPALPKKKKIKLLLNSGPPPSLVLSEATVHTWCGWCHPKTTNLQIKRSRNSMGQLVQNTQWRILRMIRKSNVVCSQS